MKSKDMLRTTLTIEHDTMERIKALAEADHQTAAQWVRKQLNRVVREADARRSEA